MAEKYTIPEQNLTYNLPEVGEVFKTTGDYGTRLFRRTSSGIEGIDLIKDYLGADLSKQGSGYSNTNDAASAALAKLSSAGIDYSKLGTYNVDETLSALGKINGTFKNPTYITDINSFKPISITPSGVTYTQGVQPGNSNAFNVVSSAKGDITSDYAPGSSTIPPIISPTISAYTVKNGDTLSKIASQNGITLDQLLANNPQFKANPNLIYPGQTVNLSKSTSTGDTTTGIPDVVKSLSAYGVNMPNLSDRAQLAQMLGINNYTETPDQVKRLLSLVNENANKAGGKPSSTGSTPTLPNQPQIDQLQTQVAQKQAEIAVINKTANEEATRAAQAIIDSSGTKVTTSNSDKITKAIIDAYNEHNSATPTKTLEQKQADLRASLNVGGAEQELADVDKEIAQLNADLTNLQAKEGNRQVSVLQINRRKSQEQMQYEAAMRDLQVKRNAAVTKVQNKLSVIETTMKYAGMDYENAQQDYATKFNQAVSIANLLSGLEDKAKTQQEKIIDDARANMTLMINGLAGKSIDFNSIDPAIKASIKAMELQANMPAGSLQLIASQGKTVKTVGSEYTNAAGERIIPIIVQDGNGGIRVQNLVSGKAQPTKATGTGDLSPSDMTRGLNWVLNNGGTDADVEKFKTDRGFQAYVMSQIPASSIVIPN